MDLPNEIQRLCLIEFLHETHQLTEFHNVLFVCKKWNEIIFEHKLYVGIDAKIKDFHNNRTQDNSNEWKKNGFNFKDLTVSTYEPNYEYFFEIDMTINNNCIVSIYKRDILGLSSNNYERYIKYYEKLIINNNEIQINKFIKYNIDKYVYNAVNFFQKIFKSREYHHKEYIIIKQYNDINIFDKNIISYNSFVDMVITLNPKIVLINMIIKILKK